MARKPTEEPQIELEINPEQVCFTIAKAREFDAKVAPVEEEPGSNPTHDEDRDVLEDRSDDPTLAALTAAIEELNIDEIVDLVALTWVGRGDFGKREWDEARALARERNRGGAAAYLTGIPALGDYLEEGLAALGYSIEDYELGRL